MSVFLKLFRKFNKNRPDIQINRDAYFMKTKYTARIRQTKAAKWFQWSDSPRKKTTVKTVKITRVIASWITLSCISENGPPFPWKPMRLAGTWQLYSSSAIPHETRMTI